MKGNEGNYKLDFEELNHNIIMLLIDPDTGNIVEANQAAVNYYGYSKDRLLSMKIQEINTLDDSMTKEAMKRAKTEKVNYFMFVHRLANNELREVEVNSFPIETDNGKLLFSIIHDVSDKTEQKLMFDTLFLDSPYGVAIMDKDKKIVNINKSFTSIFQYTQEEVKGEKINNLLSSIENKNNMNSNINIVYQGEIIKQEGLRKRRDGKLIEVEILGYPIIYHQTIIGVYAIYTDISKKKAYEKQLLLFRKILERNTEGVVITDNNGYVLWINKAFSEITGYSLWEISGKKTNILKSGVHDDDFYKSMWNQLISNGKWGGEIWNKNKKGDIYPEWLAINSIKDDSNNTTNYVGIFRDLSDKKKIDRRMSDLQQKDSLTGLYNRSSFLEKVDECIEDCRKNNHKFAIAFVDLNSFKEINSSLGYPIGDELLIALANRLLHINKQCLLSRFSADKFAILYKSIVNETEMGIHAKEILDNIKKPFLIHNTIIHITASMGMSIFPKHGPDGETLIRHAEIAMLKAHDHIGDNICFYSEDMDKETEIKFLLANNLVRATANNELTLRYQPIFDIKEKNRVVGAEALLRWNSPALGSIPPGIFIPIAEKTGQIILIGEWVLENVCKQINLWKKAGCFPIPISVNVSVKQLEQANFAQMVIDILNRNNIETNSIELELTESVSLGNIGVIVANLRKLKSSGFKISMDDFGTGFSSLGQLDLFELDKLKIDKVFIDGLVDVTRRQSMVKAIIAMAKGLDLIVVAEGIETNEQLSYLQELGCQLGQGFILSKPLKADEIEKLFLHYK